eukprot:m51a1_g11711 Sec23A (1616) ;mRNA; r:66403-72320
MAVPLSKRLVAKEWNVRLEALDELIALFQTSEPSSPEFPKYAPLMHKIIDDAYPPVKEKALEALYVFIDKYVDAYQHAADIAATLVHKCIVGRETVRNKSVDALLLLVEVNAPAVVVGELARGTQSRVPRVAALSLYALREAVRQFGVPPLPLDPILAVLEPSLEHSVREIRTEAIALCAALHKWIGDEPLRPYTSRLRQSQAKEFAAALGGAGPEGAPAPETPSSPQMAARRPGTPGGGHKCPSPQKPPQAAEDADQSEAEDVLDSLPDEWFVAADQGTWEERRDALDQLAGVLVDPSRVRSTDCTKVISTLTKAVGEQNPLILMSALKCLERLSVGLKKSFATYVRRLLPSLFDKFKERKQAAAVHVTLDVLLANTLVLSDLSEQIVASLAPNKHQKVKLETLQLVQRCLAAQNSRALAPLERCLVDALLRLADDPSQDVRKAAFSAIGAVVNVLGDSFTMVPELTGALDQAKLRCVCSYITSQSGPASALSSASASGDRKTPQQQQPPVITASVAGPPASRVVRAGQQKPSSPVTAAPQTRERRMSVPSQQQGPPVTPRRKGTDASSSIPVPVRPPPSSAQVGQPSPSAGSSASSTPSAPAGSHIPTPARKSISPSVSPAPATPRQAKDREEGAPVPVSEERKVPSALSTPIGAAGRPSSRERLSCSTAVSLCDDAAQQQQQQQDALLGVLTGLRASMIQANARVMAALDSGIQQEIERTRLRSCSPSLEALQLQNRQLQRELELERAVRAEQDARIEELEARVAELVRDHGREQKPGASASGPSSAGAGAAPARENRRASSVSLPRGMRWSDPSGEKALEIRRPSALSQLQQPAEAEAAQAAQAAQQAPPEPQEEPVRFTWNAFPMLGVEAKKHLVIPVGCIYSPLQQRVPVLPYEPLMCKGPCRTVLNPYCSIDLRAKVWSCPFCFTRNQFPPHYSEISETNLPAELFAQYSNIEYTLARPAPPPAFVFVVDTCMPEEDLRAVKDTITRSLGLLPPTALVGLVTCGTTVQVYELAFSACPKAYVFMGSRDYTTSKVQELLGLPARPANAPVTPNSFVVPLSECEFTLTTIVEDLQRDPWPVRADQRPLSSTGTGLAIAAGLLEATCRGSAGRALCLIGTPCTQGPGAVVGEELKETIRSHHDIARESAKHHRKAAKYYAGVAARAAANGHAFDLFCCSIDQVGFLEMQDLTRRTGGVGVIADTFDSDQFRRSFLSLFDKDEQTGALRTAFNATVEVQMTRELRVCGAVGNLSSLERKAPNVSEIEIGLGGTTAWRSCALERRSSLAVLFEVAGVGAGSSASPSFGAGAGVAQAQAATPALVQFLTHYQTSAGQQILRVTTVARPWLDTLGAGAGGVPAGLLEAFDQETAAVVVARMAAHRSDSEEVYDVLRWIDRTLIRLVSKFGEYRKDDAQSLRLSPRISLFPQFMFHLRRSNFLQVFNCSPDETAFYRQTLLRENVPNSLIMIQPTLDSYSLADPEPTPVLLSTKSVLPDRVLVHDTFFYIVVFLGHQVAMWRKEGYAERPEHEDLRRLLAQPVLDAQQTIADRFPFPRYVECSQYSGDARLVESNLDPDDTHTSAPQGAAVGEALVTEDVNLHVFMEHLKRAAVSQ